MTKIKYINKDEKLDAGDFVRVNRKEYSQTETKKLKSRL